LTQILEEEGNLVFLISLGEAFQSSDGKKTQIGRLDSRQDLGLSSFLLTPYDNQKEQMQE
jgi:hypothetical protein